MLALNRTRPTLITTPSETSVTLAAPSKTASKLLEQANDNTVRAVSTPRRKTLQYVRPSCHQASFKMMKKRMPLWKKILTWGQPTRGAFGVVLPQ